MPNVYVLTDENGNEIGRREYDAFGNVISETGDWSQCRSGFSPNWMELKDSGGRFVISPTRIYDKETGRYLSRDPATNAAAVNASASANALGNWENTAFEEVVAASPAPGQGPPNPYLYLRSNPLSGADAAGLQEEFVDAWAETIGMAQTVGYMAYKDVAHFTKTMRDALPPGLPSEVMKFALDMVDAQMLSEAAKEHLESAKRCRRCSATGSQLSTLCGFGRGHKITGPPGPEEWRQMTPEQREKLARALGSVIGKKLTAKAKEKMLQKILGDKALKALDWAEWATKLKETRKKSLFKEHSSDRGVRR